MKIVVADDLPASALELLRAEPGWTVDARAGRSPADLARDLVDADGLVVRSATRVTAQMLAAAPNLKIVARAGAGVDTVDVEAASTRGILVINAPGANSISVAEHTCALMLALARSLPAADRAMKEERWEKRRFLGSELRGKTLGIAGLGRIGQEVAQRARAFGMRIVAHDPFIAADVAVRLGVELLALDDVCATADYLTLHLPATPETRGLFDDERFARCKPGIRLINTARGELVHEGALRRAIERGTVAGAALDVFETEPPTDWSLAKLPQVIATPHIAASTGEAQELVGLETAAAVRDFLRDGIARNAVNFPSVRADELDRLQPWMRLADRLGSFAAQLGEARLQTIAVRYYGSLAQSHTIDVLTTSVIVGVLRPILSGAVSIVNARGVARDRGIDLVESHSSRPREFSSLISLKLETSEGERWVEGTLFAPQTPRLVSLRGVAIEAALSGAMLVITNEDRPGVIGEVGTVLGRRGINIAGFALGRGSDRAIGIVNVDDRRDGGLEEAAGEIGRMPTIHDAWIVRLPA